MEKEDAITDFWYHFPLHAFFPIIDIVQLTGNWVSGFIDWTIVID
jgi:hypothetical protein